MRVLWWKAVLLYLGGMSILLLNAADGMGAFVDFRQPHPGNAAKYWMIFVFGFFIMAWATGMIRQHHDLIKARANPSWPC